MVSVTTPWRCTLVMKHKLLGAFKRYCLAFGRGKFQCLAVLQGCNGLESKFLTISGTLRTFISTYMIVQSGIPASAVA